MPLPLIPVRRRGEKRRGEKRRGKKREGEVGDQRKGFHRGIPTSEAGVPLGLLWSGVWDATGENMARGVWFPSPKAEEGGG